MKVNCLGERHNICWIAVLLGLCLIVTSLVGCESGEQLPGGGEMVLSVSSTAFQDGDRIPSKYTCQGQNISPPLAWGEIPIGVRSLVLIMDDPDAHGGVFTHWVIFNIPSDSHELLEAVSTQAELPSDALQGKNDFGRISYDGPCPPPGSPHRYQFTLYALDRPLDLEAGASKKQVLDAMHGHILTQGQLMGTYQR
jgi:Raf kinase inhibitor-like YbhB/YbcL family protein